MGNFRRLGERPEDSPSKKYKEMNCGLLFDGSLITQERTYFQTQLNCLHSPRVLILKNNIGPGQTESQLDASSTQVARKSFQCSLARAPVQRKNLRRLVLGGQTVKNLRSLACKFELDRSERKSSHASLCKYTQVMAKRSRKLTQVFNLR